jgi:hypothetical protein
MLLPFCKRRLRVSVGDAHLLNTSSSHSPSADWSPENIIIRIRLYQPETLLREVRADRLTEDHYTSLRSLSRLVFSLEILRDLAWSEQSWSLKVCGDRANLQKCVTYHMIESLFYSKTFACAVLGTIDTLVPAMNREAQPGLPDTPHRAPSTGSPPIQKMPPELLSDIFCRYIGITRPDLMDTFQGTWLLEQVCQHWRDVLYTTPRAWANIRIGTYSSREGQRNLAVRTRLRATIAHARCSPLTVVYQNDWLKEGHAMLDILAEASHNWQDVTFYMTKAHYESLNVIKNKLPRLRRLNLSVYGKTTSLSIVDAFAQAPLLSVVSLYGWKRPAETLSLPWHQIKSYSDAANGDIFDTLRLTPNLQNFFLIASPLHYYSQEKVITLKKLQTIHLIGIPPSRVIGLLRLPSLHELKVDRLLSRFAVSHDSVADPDWLPHPASPASGIRRLQLRFLDTDDSGTLISMLKATSTLKRLTISAWVSEELQKVLQALVGFNLVPKLETLTLESDHEHLQGDIRRLMDSRKKGLSSDLQMHLQN